MSLKITVGITAYREGDWLRECWNSVLKQTYNSWNVVLILDGGADQKTTEIFNSIVHPNLQKKKNTWRIKVPIHLDMKPYKLQMKVGMYI